MDTGEGGSMTDGTHFYEPSSGHGLKHSPLRAIVAPRPIGWFSTMDKQGRVNLAPYSFFNLLCEAPPILAFASKGWKDTVRNIADTGEFVANLASFDLAAQMNLSCADLPAGEDEMAFARLAAAPSTLVKPPRVAAAPAALECRSLGINELRDLAGKPTGNFVVTGQIVGIHIRRACLVDGMFDAGKARPLGRCGYRGFYADAGSQFEMVRPDGNAIARQRALADQDNSVI